MHPSDDPPGTVAPKYGERTPDPVDEAWREFILTVGRTLHLDRVTAWLGRRLGADREASQVPPHNEAGVS